MSKAEDKALKAYPIKIAEREGYDENLRERKGFIKGYHQAEKDLLENKHETSWRLDEKLWKGIKDIEEASYQYTYDASNDWAYDIPTWKDVQDAFKAGSEWQKERMIDKTCEFLKSYRRETRDGMGYIPGIIDDETIEDFKKLMVV